MAGSSVVNDCAGFLKDDQTLQFIYHQAILVMDYVKEFMADRRDIWGRGPRPPVITRGGRNAIGFRTERGPPPAPGGLRSVLGRALPRYGWAYLDVTEQQLRASQSKEGAWESIQAVEIFDKAQQLGHYLNNCAFRDGSARLAKISSRAAAGANDKLEVIDAGGSAYAPTASDPDGAKFLQEGDAVAFAVSGTTGTCRAGTAKILEVNRDVTPNYIIVSGHPTSVAAHDYALRAGEDG